MKILIVSDSHGRSDLIYKAAEREKPDMVIHLGDIEDYKAFVEKRLGAPDIPCVFIRGNCDSRTLGDLQDEAVFTLKGHRFFCTHGHTAGVNYGLDRLLYTAEENSCDIVLYGHTHVPFDGFSEGSGGRPKIHILNPGSINLPRGDSVRSYMIMDLRDSGAYDVALKKL